MNSAQRFRIGKPNVEYDSTSSPSTREVDAKITRLAHFWFF